MDRPLPNVTEDQLKRERAKARELRKSNWWRRKSSGGTCHFCRKKFPRGEITMDHIVPLIRGGKSVKGNIVPACKECNSRKKHMLPIEWEEYLERLKVEED